MERRTLYRHFPTEADLFAACSAHYFAENPWPDLGPGGRPRPAASASGEPSDEPYAYYERTEPMFSNVLRDAELVDFARDAVVPLQAYLEDGIVQVLAAGCTVRGRRRTPPSPVRCATPSPSPRGDRSRRAASIDPMR